MYLNSKPQESSIGSLSASFGVDVEVEVK